MPLNASFDFSAPVDVNIILRGGVGGILTVRVTRGGVGVDLTGAAIRYVANTASQIVKTVGSGIAIVAPATDGVFTITFTSADTTPNNITQGVLHECKVQQLGGVPIAIFEGKLMIEGSLFITV